jgi:hypothetical protein
MPDDAVPPLELEEDTPNPARPSPTSTPPDAALDVPVWLLLEAALFMPPLPLLAFAVPLPTAVDAEASPLTEPQPSFVEMPDSDALPDTEPVWPVAAAVPELLVDEEIADELGSEPAAPETATLPEATLPSPSGAAPFAPTDTEPAVPDVVLDPVSLPDGPDLVLDPAEAPSPTPSEPSAVPLTPVFPALPEADAPIEPAPSDPAASVEPELEPADVFEDDVESAPVPTDPDTVPPTPFPTVPLTAALPLTPALPALDPAPLTPAEDEPSSPTPRDPCVPSTPTEMDPTLPEDLSPSALDFAASEEFARLVPVRWMTPSAPIAATSNAFRAARAYTELRRCRPPGEYE